MAEGRPGWADLPTDIGTLIAARLVQTDLLRFRSVCKSWNNAYVASRCSAQIECSRNCEPWFIVYGEDSQCILLRRSKKGKFQETYNINVPELNGATCIASRDGWLLIHQETAIIFFCPFTSSKIVLPQFPGSEQRDYIGAFSSPPTSKDCIVCVVRQNDKLEVELQLLYRGANAWIMHKYSHCGDLFKKIKAVAYRDDEKRFHIYDDIKGVLTFSPEDGNWKIYGIIISDRTSTDGSADCEWIPFYLSRESFKEKGMRTKLRLEEDASIDICGTVVSYHKYDHIHMVFYIYDMLFFNENLSQKSETQSRRLKGAWIEPRFQKNSPEVSWHL